MKLNIQLCDCVFCVKVIFIKNLAIVYRNLFPALRTPLERFRRHLSESSEELAPLKVWQMQALSMQAAAAVVDAADAGGDEPLRVLASIAQNFPMQVKATSKVLHTFILLLELFIRQVQNIGNFHE